nr:MAG TPA: hypothetical protein [Caudoviricetes sp.]
MCFTLTNPLSLARGLSPGRYLEGVIMSNYLYANYLATNIGR